MGKFICESFANNREGIICALCDERVTYFDRIRDLEGTENYACLSCSYREGFQPAENCLFNKQEFDATNKEFRQQMVRISRIDIDRADKVVCRQSIILPTELQDLLDKVSQIHNSSLNEEIVAGLGWYATIMIDTSQAKTPNMDLEENSLKADLPVEVMKISLDDI